MRMRELIAWYGVARTWQQFFLQRWQVSLISTFRGLIYSSVFLLAVRGSEGVSLLTLSGSNLETHGSGKLRYHMMYMYMYMYYIT